MNIRACVCGVVAALAAAFAAPGEPTSTSVLAPRPNGPRSTEPTLHVLRGATVHVDPDTTLSPAIVELDAGRIVRVVESDGSDYTPPAGAVVHDCTGDHVYAGFVDAFISVDAPTPDPNRPGAHWNTGVTPDRRASAGPGVPDDVAKDRRALGFTCAAIAPSGGNFSGLGAVVSLGAAPDDPSATFERIYADNVFHTLRFETGGWTEMRYPTSHPGAVALMRQTLIDADYQADHPGAPNALTPLEDPTARSLWFDCNRELEMLLAADVASEFKRRAVLVDNGMSFKWLDAIAATGNPVVVALRYPRKPEVSTPAKAEEVELETLMTWEQAPANAARLAGAGVTIAITASKLSKGGEFWDHMREAVKAGLSERDALAAITTTPAKLLGVSTEVGTIASGKRANLVVTEGSIFDTKSKVLDVWIDGRRHAIAQPDGQSFDGAWAISASADANAVFDAVITVSGTAPGAEGRPKASMPREGEEKPADVRMLKTDGRAISFVLDDVGALDGATILSGALQPDGTILGTGVLPDDSSFGWTASPTELPAKAEDTDEAKEGDEPAEPAEGGEHAGRRGRSRGGDEDKADDDADAAPIPASPGYPFGPYAVDHEPDAESVLITNATIWTLDDRGRIDHGWVRFSNGKIDAVGSGDAPSVPGARVIDAKGGHVSPGIIDCHSHTGLFQLGVNEGGQTVTAEVRISDSVDPSSIGYYRELASGVTIVNQLHGSANPIGGQSQTNKLRWGVNSPKAMRFEGAKPGIKFALGENVKQSNGSRSSDRYPQTRMGVEAIIRDRLSAARDYAAAMKSANPPRRDLELEALAQILAGERLVHCHSYRQDEILMLCRVARDYGFRIGTFQHGLEVYKVADAVKDAAIGASIFSDWWMYKMEVIDAIPFAGPLETEVGVVTSYNSDSDDLARRLNVDAAKAIKYARTDDAGNPVISEVEALKFVTLNPAIQLGIADRVGSIEPGKDADLVIWTASPLSTLAIPTDVFIDGREYFSTEKDEAHRAWISAERQRIIQKILKAPSKGRDRAKPGPDSPEDEILASYYDEMLRSGRDPEFMDEGDCGCGLIDHRMHYFMEKYGLTTARDHAGH